MNLRLVFVGLMALLFSVSSFAITLKLHPDVDLLALDGRRISGSLLKGADGLELERGEHQFLFRVEKPLSHDALKKNVIWRSAPLIVTFTTEVKTISIQLPEINSVSESKRFEKAPSFILIDDHGKEIASRRDHLPALADSTLEKALQKYNAAGNTASVPRFAHSAITNAAHNSLPVDLVYYDNQTTQMLHLWLEQVDLATRQRLLLWMKAPSAS